MFFGFLEFDWDPNAPGGVPGFDSWPKHDLSVAETSPPLVPLPAKLQRRETMDMLLGGLAFAAIIFGQFAAVIAVHGERKSRESDALSPMHLDDRTKLIWQSGS